MLKPWIAAVTAFIPISIVISGASTAETKRQLSVTPAQIERMAIKVEAVKPTTERTAAMLSGTIIPALNARIVAAAPFGGTVVQVHVLAGQAVEKGAVLMTVSSREMLEAVSVLAQAEAELQAADAMSRRRRALADKNIQNPTMADEADAQVAKLKAVIDQHKRTLAIGGILRADDGSYAITAPAAGRVVETEAKPGDKIEAMAAAVAIDSSDELWVEVQLPATLVGRVAPGDRVRIENGPEGNVLSVGRSLDTLTRSAKLTASVPANSGLVPGQIVSVSIVQRAAPGAFSVPASAVVRVGEADNVFVRNTLGFSLVSVEVHGRSQSSATILADIPRGAHVAASGIPQLEQLLGAE